MNQPMPVYRGPARDQQRETSDIGHLAHAIRCLDRTDRDVFYAFLHNMVTSMSSYDPDRVYIDIEPSPLPARPLGTVTSVVYYVRLGDLVKIGTTTQLAKRLRSLPHEEVLAVEPGGVDVERTRHHTFRKHRVVGEWFRYDEELRTHIASLE